VSCPPPAPAATGGSTCDPTAPAKGPGDRDPNEPAFTVRLVVTDSGGNRGEDRKVLFAYRDSGLHRGWPRFEGTGGEASQRLFDLDGDNRLDIVQADSSGNLNVPNVGTFSLAPRSTKITFAPAAGFNGVAEATYQITDDPGETASAAVRFAYGVPTAQSTIGDSIPANTPRADYQLSGQDPEGESLQFFIHQDGVTGPVPNPMDYFNFNKAGGAFDFLGGPAGTWVVTFHVVDGHQVSSNQATFTFTVNP
jgi:hypothetical protein